MSSSPLDARRPTTWDITIKGRDDWPDEHLTITSDEAHCYWFENGLVIQTSPTGFGDYHVERVVPWAQVVEYLKDAKP